LAFVVYLAIVRRLRSLLGVPWLPVIAVLTLLVIPWFAACERANPGATEFFLGGRNVWRLTREVAAPQQQPWWHTLMFLAGGVLPWSLCLPGALWQGAREGRGEDSPARRFSVLLLVWVAVTVVMYMPPPVKFFQYVMPAVPAVALLIGRHLAGVNARGRGSLLAVGAFTVLLGVGVCVFGERLLAGIGVPAAPLVPAWVAPALAGGLTAILAAGRGRRTLGVAAIALAVVAPLHVADFAVRDAYPHVVTDKPVILAAAARARPGETLVCYGYTPSAAMFYFPGPVITVGYPVPEYVFPGNDGHLDGVYYPWERAEAVFARPPSMIGLARSRDWADLQARARRRVRLMERCEPYVIFRTIPDPP